MARKAHAIFGTDEYIQPGQDDIRVESFGLFFEEGLELAGDAQRQLRTAGGIHHHQITPIFNQLIEKLAELQAIVHGLAQHLEGALRRMF